MILQTRRIDRPDAALTTPAELDDAHAPSLKGPNPYLTLSEDLSSRLNSRERPKQSTK